MFTNELFGKYRVVLVAICVNMMSFTIGTYVGWTSPVMPKLRDQTADSPLNVGVTAAQEGWISSLTSIGAFASSLFVGQLATYVGRKWTLLGSGFIIAASYLFLIFGKHIWFIYVARFLQGFGGGGGAAMVPMYVGEISTDDTRGALGSLITIFIVGGILFTYIIGPYVNYLSLQICCMAVAVSFLVTFVFMPESPYYYAIKGRKTDVIKSLQLLRGKNAQDVEDEMLKIQTEVDESMANKSGLMDLARNSVYRKSAFIVVGLLVFQQMSGATAVTFNSQSIFINAGSTLDPAVATIILGVVQLVSNLMTPFVIERTGRKTILYVSAIGIGVALIALGTFFYIQAFKNASNILWLPVPALIMFNAFYGFGFGPIPWAMMGEMLPSNIKPTVTSIACSCTWAVTFVVTRWYPEINALGAYYAFWMFAGFVGLGIVFIKFVVIETKGLSLQMIQEKLKGST
ncbi:facilitated trehalose transporter Tret1-like [Episyrphus balteatus]|uniref:facilitated trehalose transporter Tret1-like n=1 Tax=Episyrphus balteatus TaxID=286459 RepID=UPI00248504D4|nr:facilitated trehalose transporter Tret1-like [Episyrphus balteatus]